MPDRLTIPQLAALDGRAYGAEIKSRLRDDEAWVDLLDPTLVERTRAGLDRIIDSIDRQRARVGEDDPEWDRRIQSLRKWAQGRLKSMAPPVTTALLSVSSTKEARAWRAFSARLAEALAKSDPEALERLKTPYGGLSAAEWLSARKENA